MAEDRLARLIFEAVLDNTDDLPDDLGEGAECAAAAVRAAGYVSREEVRSHLTAPLDAQQAEWEAEYPRGDEPEWHVALACLNSLRDALGVDRG